MSKLRVFVVGLGNMGLSHAQAYHNNPGFEIVGLANRSEVKLPAALQSYPRFASFEEGLAKSKPDLVSIGKALGGGVPVGAALISEEVASTIAFGDHGTTYGGNLLACRAALCVLDELVGGGLLAQIGRVGRHVEQRLKAMAAAHPIVKEVRGAGLIWGLELTRDAAPVVQAALARRVIVNRTAETVVRLLPPLIITVAEADEGLDRLDGALGAVGDAA